MTVIVVFDFDALENRSYSLLSATGSSAAVGSSRIRTGWSDRITLAIARVILSDHPVRILDEPTAALDPVAESKLYDLFSKASKSKTTITVTHRLGAAKLADKIVVLKNGAVAEQGSHDELMESKGLYMNMFENQKGWYENEEE